MSLDQTGSLLSSTWPPSDGITTTVVPRSSAVFTVHGSTRIAAPASLVWQIVLNVADYPKWNTFCPRATIHSQPQNVAPTENHILHKDTSFTFHVVMDSSKPSNITDAQQRVTDVSTPEKPSDYVFSENLSPRDTSFTRDLTKVYRISWSTEGGFASRGLKTERFHEIIDLGEHGCEVRTWESQGGLLARVVKYLYKDVLMTKFQQWCDELKKEAEKEDKNRQK
ncbi:MAG: hypothetical protein Q9195_002453 [Heterodermia aff. obscurata]